MALKRMIKGHFNELLNLNKDVAQERMKICKDCPLYTMSQDFGPLCNPKLYLNTVTMETSDRVKTGFIKGCGCRLNAKTRDLESHCPTKQW